jgi:hypothetical protein
MKTKNLFRTMIVIAMLAIAGPSMAASAVTTPTENVEEHVKRLENRLEEIKAIDKSTLSKAEKKALRGEVKAIKKEMKEIGGGVYLSVGAVILIVLLIVLLA